MIKFYLFILYVNRLNNYDVVYTYLILENLCFLQFCALILNSSFLILNFYM